MVPKHFVIIGTSGSLDYLKPHENDNKRFWPVRVVVPQHDDRADLPTAEPDESGTARPDDPTKVARRLSVAVSLVRGWRDVGRRAHPRSCL
jgi:hypothetical protein